MVIYRRRRVAIARAITGATARCDVCLSLDWTLLDDNVVCVAKEKHPDGLSVSPYACTRGSPSRGRLQLHCISDPNRPRAKTLDAAHHLTNPPCAVSPYTRMCLATNKRDEVRRAAWLMTGPHLLSRAWSKDLWQQIRQKSFRKLYR
jgi:hypothetical protein